MSKFQEDNQIMDTETVSTASASTIAENLQQLVDEMKIGFFENIKLLEKLEKILSVSKLPDGICTYAAIVRDYYRDIMSSILQLMSRTTELMREYTAIVHNHYGVDIGEELDKARRIFKKKGPQKLSFHIGGLVQDSCKVAELCRSSQCFIITKDHAGELIRRNLYSINWSLNKYSRDAISTKVKIFKVARTLETIKRKCSSLYWKAFKRYFFGCII